MCRGRRIVAYAKGASGDSGDTGRGAKCGWGEAGWEAKPKVELGLGSVRERRLRRRGRGLFVGAKEPTRSASLGAARSSAGALRRVSTEASIDGRRGRGCGSEPTVADEAARVRVRRWGRPPEALAPESLLVLGSVAEMERACETFGA